MSETPAPNSLPKEERISYKPDISRLMEDGRRGSCGDIRFRWLVRESGGSNRIMVSVPKRMFKRAVKRNLLKRRIREAYRVRKAMLVPDSGIDMIFIYNSKEVLGYEEVSTLIETALRHIAKKTARS